MESKEDQQPWGIAFAIGAVFFIAGVYTLSLDNIGLAIPVSLLFIGFVVFMMAVGMSASNPPTLEEKLESANSLLLTKEHLANCLYVMLYIGANSIENEHGIPSIDFLLMTEILKKKGFTSRYIMASFRTLQEQRLARLKDKIVYFTMDEDATYTYLSTVGKVPVLNQNNIV